MEIKHFAKKDWVEHDMIVLEYIMSPENSADHFTKSFARTASYKHSDVIMGRIPSEYYKGLLQPTYNSSTEILRRLFVQITDVPRLSAHFIKYAPHMSAHKIAVFNVFKTEN